MKIVAIFNIWDGEEIFKHSFENIRPLVDDVIIVWSRLSNSCQIVGNFDPTKYKAISVNHEPSMGKTKHENERDKRNAGLREAKRRNFTHFIMCDADEFYDPNEFLADKERVEKDDLNGLVCNLQIYFKRPDLTIGLDPTTRVPTIQKLTPSVHFAPNKRYPFAYDERGGCRIDPTRQLNTKDKVEWSETIMHHYSHVRDDIRVKIASSSANLGRSSLLEDWTNAEEGYFVKMYQRTLVKCENQFNIQL